MAEVSIGGAVGEGFALIRRRPGSVLTWGVVQVAATVAFFALLAPFYASLITTALHQAQSGSPPVAMPLTAGVMQAQSLGYLVDLLNLMVSSVLYCAAFRAVLHPEQNRFAYMRVGAPELFLFVLIIAGFIAFFIGLLIAMIPIGIVVGVLVAVHAGVAGVIVGVVGGVAAFVAVTYLALRFALVGPMMVDDGRFHLGEAWALTRGKTVSLFAVGIVVFLILLAAELVFGLVLAAVGFGMLASIAGGLQNLAPFFHQPPQVIMGKLSPLLVVAVVIWTPLMSCALALMGAPWARAYADLRPPRDVAEAFT
jgi:hypothetical protein